MAGYTGAIPVQASSIAFASQIAEEEINSAGGIEIAGVLHPIQIVKADDKCDPAEGQLAIDKLISVDQVHYLVGGLCSNAVIAALPTVARSSIPFLVTSAGSDTINKTIAENSWSSIFHFGPTEIGLNTFLAQFLTEKIRPKTVSILADDSDPGHDAANAIRAYFTAEFPSLQILSENYVRINAGDMLAELAKIKAEGPDVLFYQGTGANSEAFFTQFLEVGIQAIIASDAAELGRSDFLKAHAEALEGAFANVRWSPVFETPLTKSFLEKFATAAGRDADFFALQQYDGIYVLKDALERAGSMETDAVVSALEATDLLGAWGTHKFLPLSEGHRGVWEFVIAQVRGGEPVVVYPDAAAQDDPVLPDWFVPAP